MTVETLYKMSAWSLAMKEGVVAQEMVLPVMYKIDYDLVKVLRLSLPLDYNFIGLLLLIRSFAPLTFAQNSTDAKDDSDYHLAFIFHSRFCPKQRERIWRHSTGRVFR